MVKLKATLSLVAIASLVLMALFFIPLQQGSAITLADKALCFIFMPASNTTASCTVPDDTFTFLASGGIEINATGPKELTFTVSSNGTVTDCTNIGSGVGVCSGAVLSDIEIKTLVEGAGIDISSDAETVTINFTGAAGNVTGGFSLGGDADVFKNEASGILNFRGLTAGDGIELTERPNDILINATTQVTTLGDLTDVVDGACPNDQEIIVFNASSAQWECQDQGDFIETSGGANSKEMLRGHMSRGSAGDATIAFADYTHRMFEYTDGGDEELSWAFALSPEYVGGDINVKIYWMVDNFNGAGDVCFEGQFAPVNPGDDISDFSAIGNTLKTVCKAAPATEIFEVTTITFSSAEHGISGDEMVLFQLTRNAVGDASDTYAEDVQGYGVIIEW